MSILRRNLLLTNRNERRAIPPIDAATNPSTIVGAEACASVPLVVSLMVPMFKLEVVVETCVIEDSVMVVVTVPVPVWGCVVVPVMLTVEVVVGVVVDLVVLVVVVVPPPKYLA
jgi:hypothetical protein